MSKTNRYRTAIASLFYVSVCFGPTPVGFATAALMALAVWHAPADILPLGR